MAYAVPAHEVMRQQRRQLHCGLARRLADERLPRAHARMRCARTSRGNEKVVQSQSRYMDNQRCHVLLSCRSLQCLRLLATARLFTCSARPNGQIDFERCAVHAVSGRELVGHFPLVRAPLSSCSSQFVIESPQLFLSQ
jgi:hypothetical protein